MKSGIYNVRIDFYNGGTNHYYTTEKPTYRNMICISGNFFDLDGFPIDVLDKNPTFLRELTDAEMKPFTRTEKEIKAEKDFFEKKIDTSEYEEN